MSREDLPPVGHTDENGVFHWGSPADRLARIEWEEMRRLQMGAGQRARREAIHQETQARKLLR